MMKLEYLIFVIVIFWANNNGIGQDNQPIMPNSSHNLKFNFLPQKWDEALSIGNGTLGALVWQKDTTLRMSIDRADLWDNRPMKGLDRPEFNYKWVTTQVEKKQYDIVQKYFDDPYELEVAPTKLPGAAIEFIGKNWGKPVSSELNIFNSEVIVKYSNNVNFRTFVHANQDIGWFRIENVDTINFKIIAPNYDVIGDKGNNNLSKLGYPKGKFTKTKNAKYYEQTISIDEKYAVIVRWRRHEITNFEGSWAIVMIRDSSKKEITETGMAITKTYLKELKNHAQWWSDFWNKSSVFLPDSVLEKQYYLDLYKFGSVARRGSPAISLQSVWTADNGKLPAWKGDFHFDLNVQMSYWLAYKSNHLSEAYSLIDFVESNWDNFKLYTKQFYGTTGINMPGVMTINGKPLGGWIQYACSPTVSAWISQHYYLQWQYSKNRRFLERRCYPWFKETILFLEQILIKNEAGLLQLPISSSPEIHDNSLKAWFRTPTNFDNALIHFVFEKGAELASELKKDHDKIHFDSIFNMLQPLEIDAEKGLLIAKDNPYKQSHRHFSHLLAIYPLGLITAKNFNDNKILNHSLSTLDEYGSDYWTGYSYCWLANLKARAKDGDGAAKALKIFSEAFCSPNSFHLNGDQSSKKYSKIKDKVFTLEGNFGFAAGVQEMLIQDHEGWIEVFPAIPKEWKNVRFDNLRVAGAALVSAIQENGNLDRIQLIAESNETYILKLPFKTWFVDQKDQSKVELIAPDKLKINLKKDESIWIKNGYE